MAIPAILLYAGRTLTIGDVCSLTEIWLSSNLRPDLTTTYLPEIGDSPTESNIISGQSVLGTLTVGLSAALDSLHCKSITEQEYLEGNVRGTIYQVNYDDVVTPAGGWSDPTNDNAVVLSISSAAQVDTYTKDPEDSTSLNIWMKESSGSYTQLKNPSVTKITNLINVSTTKRYRSYTPVQIMALSMLAGYTNESEMWGFPAGCILYEGGAAAPIQEVYNSQTILSWNVTRNYSIKFIPGLVSEPTWDYVWYNGVYSPRYLDATGTNKQAVYPRTTLPNDLP